MTKQKRKNAGSLAKIMQENTLNAITHNTSYTVTLEEDGDDLIMPIPDEVLQQLDWKEGDELEWGYCHDRHCITLRKALSFDL